MNIDELYEILNKYNLNPSNRALASIWDMDVASFSRKKKAGTAIKQKNIEQVEEFFNINISKTNKYSGERQNDTTVDEKSSQFGKRLSELQAQHNFLDREMAQLLKISEPAYLKLVTCKTKPDLDVLNRIKQNFKVSIDYLLYGD